MAYKYHHKSIHKFLAAKNKEDMSEIKDYRLTYSHDDVVILIPNESKSIDTDVYFRGMKIPHINDVGFYSSVDQHDKSVLEIDFNRTLIDAIKTKDNIFLKFLEHIEANEPHMTSNKTVSMGDVKMRLLLK